MSADDAGFDDIEVATFEAAIGVQAADLTGGTGFTGGDSSNLNGLELLDYDEFVDRNEELILLAAHHSLRVYANATETADGNVRGIFEVSASPTGQIARNLVTNTVQGNIVGRADQDDSIDLVGRVLVAVGHAPFSDGATGVGGAGSEGQDEVVLTTIPGEMARFHPRDELFLNGRFDAWNIDDAGIHAEVSGQHVYGVIEG